MTERLARTQGKRKCRVSRRCQAGKIFGNGGRRNSTGVTEVVVFLQLTEGKSVYFLSHPTEEPTEIDFQPFVNDLAEQGIHSRVGMLNPRQSREEWYYSLLKKDPCANTSWAIRKAAEGEVSYVARMLDGSFAAVRAVVLPPGSTFFWKGGAEPKATKLEEIAYDLIEARQEGLTAAITSSLFGITSVQRLSWLSDYGRAILAPRLELPEEPLLPQAAKQKKQKGAEPCPLAGVAPGDEASFTKNESDVSSSTVDELFDKENDESDDAELVTIHSNTLAPDATTKSSGGSPISPSPPPISCEMRLQGGGPKGTPGGQYDDMPQLEWSSMVDQQLPLLQPIAYHLPPPPPLVALQPTWERPTAQDKAYEPLQLPEWILAEFHALLWEVYEVVVVAPLQSQKVHTPFTRIYNVLEKAAMRPWKRTTVWMRFHHFCEKAMRRLEVKEGVIVEFPIGTASRTVVHGGAVTMCVMYALWWHKEGHHPPPLGDSRTRMGLALPVTARARAPPAPTPPEMWANGYTGDMRRLHPEADIWPKLRAMRGSADARAHQRQRQRRRNGQGAAQGDHIPHATLLHPWQHGTGHTKPTALYLSEGLPPIVPTCVVPGRIHALAQLPPGHNRGALRSRTYLGIAGAMALQWMPSRGYRCGPVDWRGRDPIRVEPASTIKSASIEATIAGRDPDWTRHPVGLPFRATVVPTIIWTTTRRNILDDCSMSPTTLRRKPKQRKTTTPELPKKGRLQSSTAKITRAICVLAVKGPSYIWRRPNE